MRAAVLPGLWEQARVWGVWLLLAGLEAGAQISLKLAAVGAAGGAGEWAPVGTLAAEPLFWVSLACDGAAFWVWMRILYQHDLSVAVPVSAICYFATILASYALLHEPVAPLQGAGLLLMGLGIHLTAGERGGD